MMKSLHKVSYGSLCLLMWCSAQAQPDMSGGVTTTFQASNDSRVDNELTASADLVLSWSFTNSELYTYIEANNSPKMNGVSGVLPEANADAGSAVDEDREGRIQISEFGYRYFFNDMQTLTLGLIDVTAYFDQSRIASDENTQFLGVSFVQNPTIEFPDYTLGIVYENVINPQTVLRAALTASNGIADNPNLSYAQLVDVEDVNKGAFSIVSITRKSPQWLFKAGAWSHTADHESLDGTRFGRHNYGAYFLGGYTAGKQGVNLRLGQSNKDVSLAHRFVALSYRYQLAPVVFGAGAAKILISEYDPTGIGEDTLHYETYFRYRLNQNVFITADIQYLINSNFDASDTIRDDRQQLYGLRMTYVVE